MRTPAQIPVIPDTKIELNLLIGTDTHPAFTQLSSQLAAKIPNRCRDEKNKAEKCCFMLFKALPPREESVKGQFQFHSWNLHFYQLKHCSHQSHHWDLWTRQHCYNKVWRGRKHEQPDDQTGCQQATVYPGYLDCVSALWWGQYVNKAGSLL